jgi:hypothetical protein
MYHPPGGSGDEFIEVANVGPDPVALEHVAIEGGISFRFADGDVGELGPGENVLVVENRAAFAAAYGTAGMRIAGEYDGGLDNAGERIALVYGAGTAILDFAWSDGWWPRTDGGGRSLGIVDPTGPAAGWDDPASWTESAADGGSPGGPDGASGSGGLRRPGDANGDGAVDLSDAVGLLLRLFAGDGPEPCAPGAEAALLDWTGDGGLDISDALGALGFLFLDGPAHARGTGCIRVAGCGEACPD